MSADSFAFKVHYGGKFNRSDGCTYVGGNVSMHNDPYDSDCLSFIEIEGVVKEYGYKSNDLIYYNEPDKNMVEELRIISGDPDVLDMVAAHVGKESIVLYVVGFENGPEKELVNDVDEDRERCRFGIGTKWWSEALSSDDDLFDVNVGDDDVEEGGGMSFEEGAPLGMGGTSYEEGGPSNDRDDHDDIDPAHANTPDVRSDGGDDNVEDYLSDITGSDTLKSLEVSEDKEDHPPRSALEFRERDLGSVSLVKA
ncbi:hypothetical protein CJ030_MR6G023561 [Morella rubra]|uniref:PB1-like domain-containing protein n=1 Tax=Morella rubra TaxID=262757 RepID=A0A6A1VAZ3_9ROSI|nr:hypothetical protein CJ030_MR6G023561 [Morella rubra]